jgi:hypothetical protein
MYFHEAHRAPRVIERAPIDGLLQHHAQDGEHVVHGARLAVPQPVLEPLHVLVGDGVEPLGAERREQVVLQDQLLVCDAARLQLVRACMAIHKPWRELFECRNLLLGQGGAAEQELALSPFSPALRRGLRRYVEPLPFTVSPTIL